MTVDLSKTNVSRVRVSLSWITQEFLVLWILHYSGESLTETVKIRLWGYRQNRSDMSWDDCDPFSNIGRRKTSFLTYERNSHTFLSQLWPIFTVYVVEFLWLKEYYVGSIHWIGKEKILVVVTTWCCLFSRRLRWVLIL